MGQGGEPSQQLKTLAMSCRDAQAPQELDVLLRHTLSHTVQPPSFPTTRGCSKARSMV